MLHMISEIRSHLKQLLCIRFNLCPSHRTDVGLPLALLDSCIVQPSRNVLIGGRIWRGKGLRMGLSSGPQGRGAQPRLRLLHQPWLRASVAESLAWMPPERTDFCRGLILQSAIDKSPDAALWLFHPAKFFLRCGSTFSRVFGHGSEFGCMLQTIPENAFSNDFLRT